MLNTPLPRLSTELILTKNEPHAATAPKSERLVRTGRLAVRNYVDTSDEEERIEVAEAVRKLRVLEQKRATAEATMNHYLAELGYDG